MKSVHFVHLYHFMYIVVVLYFIHNYYYFYIFFAIKYYFIGFIKLL